MTDFTQPAGPLGALPQFVETWKGIGSVLCRSERWCRYTANRREDPLPVFKVGGIVRINVPDLEDWLARERHRTIARPAAFDRPQPLVLIA